MKKAILLVSVIVTLSAKAQNVYDTYNPWNPQIDSIVGTYSFTNVVPNFIGEYQLFTVGLTAWQDNVLPTGTYSISYRIEAVSFPFIADCSNGDCGNISSTTRNLIMPESLNDGDFVFHKPFFGPTDTSNTMTTMGEPSELLSNAFTQTGPLIGTRDLLPHTIIKHTYYFHAGSTINDPVLDSFSFVLDHTRGLMSRYPFTANNDDSDEAEHDITIIPWMIYPDTDSFYSVPTQTSNFLQTIDYYPYPAKGYPSFATNNVAFSPSTSDLNQNPAFYIHPSPYSLLGIMLGNAYLGPFAGSNDTVLMPGCTHTYFIDTALDFTKINPREKIIYNPSHVFITAADPVIFPSGYTFMTAPGRYPSAAQITALDPNAMYGDPRNVPIIGSALNLTNNPNTAASDAVSFYQVTQGCTLRIESCVTLYDCQITVDSGAVLQLDSTAVFGNYTLVAVPGSIIQSLSNDPLVACKYMCYEESNYNTRHVTISSNTTWDTTNIESAFPGNATWSAATNNTAKFVEGFTVDSGATLTVNAGVNLLFGPLAKVIVRKGGKLVINGTSSDSCYFGPACQMEWKGIEVWGNPTITQQTTSGYPLQGFVDAEYCVFEHARHAMVAGAIDSTGAEGGVIDVDRCSFLNNAHDIVMLPYRNYAVNSLSTTVNNRSQITRSAFRTTEYFYDPLLNESNTAEPRASAAHISLRGVKFGSIQDCIFSTEYPENYSPHLRGVGIYAIESGFYLRPQYPCTFENLSDGIFVQSSGLDAKVVNITGAAFSNNIHGIVMEGTRFSAIFQNEINVPESPEFGYSTGQLEKGYDKPVGIFMQGSVDYIIAENEFNVNDTASQLTPVTNCDNCCYDIVVYNSVMMDSVPPVYGTGKIYKNKIHHATIGIQFQGDNGSGPGTEGVDLKCNEFDDLELLDVGIIGTSNISSQIRDQGDCQPGSPELQATNQFLRSCSADETNITIDAHSSGFVYQDQIASMPICTTNVVQSTDCSVILPDSNECTSFLNWGWYQPFLLTKYNTASTNHQTARHNLDSLIDGGDTEAVLDRIENGNPGTLYDDMMTLSPWLSDAALVLLLEMRDVLTDEEVYDIFVANSGLTPQVYDAFVNANPAFNETYLVDLAKEQDIPGARIQLEQTWSLWVFQADLAASELVSHGLANDSLDAVAGTLEHSAQIPEMQKLFIVYMAVRNFTAAEEVLQEIKAAHGGQASTWHQLASISLSQSADNRTWVNATENEYLIADSIWQLYPEKQFGARSIAGYYYGKQFAREPFGLESDARYSQQTTTANNVQTEANSLLVYPNPASSAVTVVATGTHEEAMTLEVLNTLGQIIEHRKITSAVPIEIDLNSYPAGMLYLRLSTDGVGIATEKLIISK